VSGRSPTLSLRHWTPQQHREPHIRVGIILDEDARNTVSLQLPDESYRAEGLEDGIRTLRPRTRVQATHAGNALALQFDTDHPTLVRSLDLWPRDTKPLARGTGILVRDVPAGRGFHWYKRIPQTFSGQLRLLPGQSGVVVINELPLEDYLAGVIAAEMSPDCPAEFLKAQSIVARSWVLACTEPKHLNQPFDRCNDDCCQRYQGTTELTDSLLQAFRATRGCVLLAPDGAILDANYSKSCGGVTETPWAVWGLDKPGIQPVVDAPANAPELRFFPVTNANLNEYLDGAWIANTNCYCGPKCVPPEKLAEYLGRVDQPQDYFRWTIRYRRAELEELLRRRLPDAAGLVEVRDLRVRARGVSGRAYALEIEWTDRRGEPVRRRVDSEYRIRYVLHPQFLYSSAFDIRVQRDQEGRIQDVTLRGAGWGHGVGMCQIGALGMALTGHSWQQICQHYYPAASWQTVYT